MGAKLTYGKPWHSNGPSSSRTLNNGVAGTRDKTYEYTTDEVAPGNNAVQNVFSVSMAVILCQSEVQQVMATHTEGQCKSPYTILQEAGYNAFSAPSFPHSAIKFYHGKDKKERFK
jgi:hypothetical protein